MKILLVSPDLMAQARLERAAPALSRVDPGRLLDALRNEVPDVAILDLDAGGDVLRTLEEARAEGLAPGRLIAYFSHVDTSLGEAARAAGIEALPRGRFWREAPELLGTSG